MVNSPIPDCVRHEAERAANTLRSFTIPNRNGPFDGIIPTGVIANAKGLAIITVAKVGFLFTARAGSGIVVAKLPDGAWSAPSAIGLIGIGGGLEMGVELTDFVIILNTFEAVLAFARSGNLTLGGNISVAIGPLGRNAEFDYTMRNRAAVYTYSKTKGLFVGISIEGTILLERKEANTEFYGKPIQAYEILLGRVYAPSNCLGLYNMLEMHERNFRQSMLNVTEIINCPTPTKKSSSLDNNRFTNKFFQFFSNKNETEIQKTKSSTSKLDFKEITEPTKKRSYIPPSLFAAAFNLHFRNKSILPLNELENNDNNKRKSTTPTFGNLPESSLGKLTNVLSKITSLVDETCKKNQPTTNQILCAKALYDFDGDMPYDLSFKKGQTIYVITATETQHDWWEGTVGGKVGLFPANFVKILE